MKLLEFQWTKDLVTVLRQFLQQAERRGLQEHGDLDAEFFPVADQMVGNLVGRWQPKARRRVLFRWVDFFVSVFPIGRMRARSFA